MKKVGAVSIFLFFSLLLVLLFSGCKMEQAEEPSYSSAMTDNILQAIVENNYLKFSQDFDDAMKKALPESKFNELSNQLNEKIGRYTNNKETILVQKKDNLYVVIYQAEYEKSKKVKITISFRETGGQPQVAGLYFDAPELR